MYLLFIPQTCHRCACLSAFALALPSEFFVVIGMAVFFLFLKTHLRCHLFREAFSDCPHHSEMLLCFLLCTYHSLELSGSWHLFIMSPLRSVQVL